MCTQPAPLNYFSQFIRDSATRVVIKRDWLAPGPEILFLKVRTLKRDGITSLLLKITTNNTEPFPFYTLLNKESTFYPWNNSSTPYNYVIKGIDVKDYYETCPRFSIPVSVSIQYTTSYHSVNYIKYGTDKLIITIIN